MKKTFASSYNPETDSWLAGAAASVEKAIDAVVEEFIKHPYLHRVEHSFHVRVIEQLKQEPALNQRAVIAGEEIELIHKEWPEALGADGQRRGNFDIAILSPAQCAALPAPALSDYAEGLLPAPVVIEIGLNYGESHLENDIEKLIRSKPKHGYLLHLLRESACDERKLAELVANAAAAGYKTAYAQVTGSTASFKYLGAKGQGTAHRG